MAKAREIRVTTTAQGEELIHNEEEIGNTVVHMATFTDDENSGIKVHPAYDSTETFNSNAEEEGEGEVTVNNTS